MSDAGARPIAPSSRLALYLAAVISVYLVPDAMTTLALAAALSIAAAFILRGAPRTVPRARWRAVIVFIVWVFLMRFALDAVAGVPMDDPAMWIGAAQQAARVSILGIGVLVLIAVTSARDIVEELETSRLPRTVRLLVMMLVQYPRVLRERFDQIVEAQVARGADRPRSAVQRLKHGATLLLPVMQSELNAVGERAGLMHLRGLDLEVTTRGDATARAGRDLAVLVVAAIAVITAAAFRFVAR